MMWLKWKENKKSQFIKIKYVISFDVLSKVKIDQSQ